MDEVTLAEISQEARGISPTPSNGAAPVRIKVYSVTFHGHDNWSAEVLQVGGVARAAGIWSRSHRFGGASWLPIRPACHTSRGGVSSPSMVRMVGYLPGRRIVSR